MVKSTCDWSAQARPGHAQDKRDGFQNGRRHGALLAETWDVSKHWNRLGAFLVVFIYVLFYADVRKTFLLLSIDHEGFQNGRRPGTLRDRFRCFYYMDLLESRSCGEKSRRSKVIVTAAALVARTAAMSTVPKEMNVKPMPGLLIWRSEMWCCRVMCMAYLLTACSLS